MVSVIVENYLRFPWRFDSVNREIQFSLCSSCLHSSSSPSPCLLFIGFLLLYPDSSAVCAWNTFDFELLNPLTLVRSRVRSRHQSRVEAPTEHSTTQRWTNCNLVHSRVDPTFSIFISLLFSRRCPNNGFRFSQVSLRLFFSWRVIIYFKKNKYYFIRLTFFPTFLLSIVEYEGISTGAFAKSLVVSYLSFFYEIIREIKLCLTLYWNVENEILQRFVRRSLTMYGLPRSSQITRLCSIQQINRYKLIRNEIKV